MGYIIYLNDYPNTAGVSYISYEGNYYFLKLKVKNPLLF